MQRLARSGRGRRGTADPVGDALGRHAETQAAPAHAAGSRRTSLASSGGGKATRGSTTIGVEAGQPDPARWMRSAGLSIDTSAKTARRRSGATTPCTHSAGSGWSTRTGRRGAAGRAGPCTARPTGQLGPFVRRPPRSGPTRCRSGRTARCRPGTTGRAQRPVVCDDGAPTWVPTSSGGSSGPVQRWICCRSSASMQSLAQTRSVCCRTPRSTRAPPEEQDSISSPGRTAPELVHQPVGGEGLRVHAGHPVRAAAGLDQVAVVVPLQVADRVLVEQRAEPLAEVARRPRGRSRSSTCWCRASAGQAAAGAEDPLRVRAGEVGVRVDHLRLDPEAELHARDR